jgi:hypothetical protein
VRIRSERSLRMTDLDTASRCYGYEHGAGTMSDGRYGSDESCLN